MNKYALCLLSGLVLGFILALLFHVVVETDTTPGTYRADGNQTIPSTIGSSIDSLCQLMAKQNELLSNLNESIGFLSFYNMNQTPTSSVDEEPSKEKVFPTIKSIPAFMSGKVGMDWVNVLEKSVARTLVEYGLTPYDPEVAPLVREVNTKYRAASRQHSKSYKELKTRYPNRGRGGSPDYIAFKNEFEVLNNQYELERSAILEALANDLTALQAKDGSNKGNSSSTKDASK